MKKSTKTIIILSVILSLGIGFLIGISIDFPKTDTSNLAGTIGKMNNYRNVKVTENDVQLRSELTENESLLKSYRQFFATHYTACVKLSENIGFAIQTAEDIPQFREDYSMEIENLKKYKETIEQSRKDLLLAITVLQKINDSDEYNLSQTINNANIAVAQIKYKQNDVLAFVESIEKFVQGNNPYEFNELIKAHDLLSVNQLIIAAATNDKPTMKVYDKKPLYSSEETLKKIEIPSNELLKAGFSSDITSLQNELKDSDIMKAIASNEQIGMVFSQINVIIPAYDKLGGIVWWSTEKLGIDSNTDKIGCWNTEKLGTILNSEKLGIYDTQKLGVCDMDKLGSWNIEQLGVL